METHVLDWGQFALYAAGAAALAVWALRQLLTSMTSSYNTMLASQVGEIARLTGGMARKEEQVSNLQTQMNECKKLHEDAAKREMHCQDNMRRLEEKLNAALLRINLLEKPGGSHEGVDGGGRPGDAMLAG